MSHIYTSADQLIGRTPLLELTHLEKKYGLKARILVKLEYLNPAGSVKDRIARAMIDDAEARGLLHEGSVIIDKIISANKPNYGFDAQNEVFVDDMIAAGIVDPTKVTRSALENAASVAEMVLTTESLVADLPEPPAAGGDMGGMY